MYNFIDTNEYQSGTILPSEALMINGQWIEEVIPGYQTLHVSGRELLESEIDDLEIGRSDGRYYKGKRYPGRVITVTYRLLAESSTAFREAYNKLNALLDVEQAQLIFNDEKDKYFIGTKRGNSTVEPGRNNVIGEIEFYCADPFKYSVDEKTVIPTLDDNNVIVVEYTGTFPAYPKLDVTFSGDAGYVAFIDQEGNILQFGNEEEVDGEQKARSEELIVDAMASGTTGWTVNNATLEGINNFIQQGSFEFTTRHGTPCIEAGSYGVVKNNAWYGPSYTKIVPADSTGEVGAVNCLFGWTHFFVVKNQFDIGVAQFVLTGESGENIASISFAKTTQKDFYGLVKLMVNGNKVYEGPMSCEADSLATSWDNGWSYIQKFEDEITFKVGKFLSKSFRDSEIKNAKATQVSFFMGSWQGMVMTNNGVRRIRFTKHNVNTWVDVPNKFSDSDLLEVDCETGNISLNKTSELGLGAIGNDWEEFCLRPGVNQIYCNYSSWSERPIFKLKYREVFL